MPVERWLRQLYDGKVKSDAIRHEQIEFLQFKMEAAVRKQPLLEALYEMLLSIGGEAVVAAYEPDVEELIERGERFPVRGLRRKSGYVSACHFNVARLHKPGQSDVATGYALSEDGLWRAHSWGYQDGRVIETTEPRKVYFGVLLTPREAAGFCRANLR